MFKDKVQTGLLFAILGISLLNTLNMVYKTHKDVEALKEKEREMQRKIDSVKASITEDSLHLDSIRSRPVQIP